MTGLDPTPIRRKRGRPRKGSAEEEQIRLERAARKPVCRRRKKPSERCDYRYGIFCTKKQWKAWSAFAKSQGLSQSEWLRRAAKEAAERGGVFVEADRPAPLDIPVVPSIPAIPGSITLAEVHDWLACNIRRERRKRLLLDRDLAEMLKVNILAVIRLQAASKPGKARQTVGLKVLTRLANVLGVTPSDLLRQPQDMRHLLGDQRGRDAKREREELAERLAKMPPERRALSELEESLGIRFDPE